MMSSIVYLIFDPDKAFSQFSSAAIAHEITDKCHMFVYFHALSLGRGVARRAGGIQKVCSLTEETTLHYITVKQHI